MSGGKTSLPGGPRKPRERCKSRTQELRNEGIPRQTSSRPTRAEALMRHLITGSLRIIMKFLCCRVVAFVIAFWRSAPTHPPLLMTASYPRTVVTLVLSASATLSAQNIAMDSKQLSTHHESAFGGSYVEADRGYDPGHELRQVAPGFYQVPRVKAQSRPPEAPPVFVTQDCLTLNELQPGQSVESFVDFGLLRNPPPLQMAAASGNFGLAELFAKNIQTSLAQMWAIYRPQGEPVAAGGCETVGLSVRQQLKLDPSLLLEAVEREVSANAGCACEIVKAAIQESAADPELVAKIVEVAIMAAPESMRIISQCALAVMPESLAAVQSLLARLDPGGGDGVSGAKSAKSAKGAKVVLSKGVIAKPVVWPDPLDLPPRTPPWVPPLIPPGVTNDRHMTP